MRRSSAPRWARRASLYQAILRNPLADPYLLGVSSGATLAIFVWGLLGAALGPGAA